MPSGLDLADMASGKDVEASPVCCANRIVVVVTALCGSTKHQRKGLLTG